MIINTQMNFNLFLVLFLKDQHWYLQWKWTGTIFGGWNHLSFLQCFFLTVVLGLWALQCQQSCKFELYMENDFYFPFKIALAHVVCLWVCYCLRIVPFTSTVRVFKKNRNDRLWQIWQRILFQMRSFSFVHSINSQSILFSLGPLYWPR